MQHARYNTPTYRKLFKGFHERYARCNKFKDIEGRVRGICEYVEQSNLGVSIWSCEGHDDTHKPYEGYIMFAARNREDAATLLEVLQTASAEMVAYFGWNARGEIETNVAQTHSVEGEEYCYPAIIIRSPHNGRGHNADMLESKADCWWDRMTKSIKRQLRLRIELQQHVRSVA